MNMSNEFQPFIRKLWTGHYLEGIHSNAIRGGLHGGMGSNPPPPQVFFKEVVVANF